MSLVATPPAPTRPKSRLAGQKLQSGREHLRQLRWAQAERDLSAAMTGLVGSMYDWLGLAVARMKLQQLEPAIQAGRRAMELDPTSLEARGLVAQCLFQQQRYQEAERVYAGVPAGATLDHDWLLNHGITLVHVGRAEQAIGLFMQALSIKMDSVRAYVRLGAAFKQMKMFEEAVECFRTAAALDPDNLTAHGFLVHLDQFACRWDSFDADVQTFLDTLMRIPADDAESHECTPFALVAIPHDPMAMLQAARFESRRQAKGVTPFKPRAIRPVGERLRLGYVSGDMHQHATAMLISEVLERHDRTQFEVFVYSHGRNDRSPMRQRLEAAVEHFIDTSTLTTEQIARRAREDGIDILVDLKGYTQNHRFRAMAFKPAPVQVTWLGFPGTSGSDAIDYYIGDPFVTPLGYADHYSEKLAQMPLCYQPNDRQRPRPQATHRAQWSLPENRPVLACFNNVYKITPPVFDSWARILGAVPDAVLWLLDSNEQAKTNLRREAQRRGIDPQRLLFAPSITPALHQSRLSCADLMLDTWPCNAHTTASDALWAGLPMITLPGETFSSRVAASLLQAVGMADLIATDMDEYEALAIGLLRDKPRLAALRKHLIAGRDTLPLFDSERFARDLEALYGRMAARARASLPPDHLPAQAR